MALRTEVGESRSNASPTSATRATSVRPTAHRASLLHFSSDPGAQDDPASFEFIEDGLLVVRDGLVAAVCPAGEMLAALPPDC